MPVIFEQFPGLASSLPHVPLGVFPTPVDRLERLGEDLGLGGLWIKRDDLSGETYGGNKIRKLEFLLGRAVAERRREVMTYGAAGSNHALATAIYAKAIGMRGISMLTPQPNARYIRKNLLMSLAVGAELIHCGSHRYRKPKTLATCMGKRLAYGRTPMIIPVGGTSPLGTVGFVEAAFELAAQIRDGVLPEPDMIYVAFGSMGTAAGIALGLKAAGIASHVEMVRVVPEMMSNSGKFRSLVAETAALLHSADPSFPGIEPGDLNCALRDGFFGEEYARFTPEGVEAMKRMKDTEGIVLEGTYTGKTFAALLADAGSGRLKGKTALFWNTYNSRDLTPHIRDLDYHDLPRPFHRYFEEDFQPLDE